MKCQRDSKILLDACIEEAQAVKKRQSLKQSINEENKRIVTLFDGFDKQKKIIKWKMLVII